MRKPTVTAEQRQQLIEWSLKGRQNSYKRNLRRDAELWLESTACAELLAMQWYRHFGDPAKMPVIHSERSPMNSRRKILTLACWHEVWSGVRLRTAACPKCREIQATNLRKG